MFLKKAFLLFAPYLHKTAAARWRTFFTLLILLAEVAMATGCPFLAKKIVNALGADYSFSLVLLCTLLYGGLWILSKLATDIEEIIFFPVINEAIKDSTYRTLEHLHKIPLGAQKYASSEIISMVKRISLSARSFIKVFFLQLPRAIVKLILAAAILMQFHYYGFWVIAALFLSFFSLYRSIRWYAATREKAWSCTDQVTRAIHDSILYTKTARFHQNFEMSRLGRSLEEEARLWNQVNTRLHITSAIVSCIFGVAFIAILSLMAHQRVSVGDFVMIQGLLLAVFVPLRDMTRQIRLTAESVVDIQNIVQILDIPAMANTISRRKEPCVQKLFLQDVTFFYENQVPIFTDLTLCFSAGEKVLIKGDTGSGKSTFCHLLASLLSPKKGEVFLDKQSIENFTKEELGKMVLFIPQQAHVLNATLLENLTYGYDNVCQNQVHEVLEKVGLTSMVHRLSQGLYTSIEEKGERLSGGERQKLALARALLLKPSILILDEATQSLDRENEERILEHIFEEIPLVFVVSHQLEYFDRFDRVLQFGEGKIFSRQERLACLGS